MASLNNHLTPYERIEIVNAVRGKLPVDYSTEMTIIPLSFEEQSSRIPVIIPEKEAVNAFFEDFYMKRGTCQIWYRTTAEWDAEPDLIARKDIIYVYTDADSYVDPVSGETVYVPGIKFGDDVSYLIDLPMMSSATSQAVLDHMADMTIHFAPGEKAEVLSTLNNKIGYTELNEVVEINQATGTFTEETLNGLLANRIKPIKYNNKLFSCMMHQGQIYKYMVISHDPNNVEYIEVNSSTGAWSYNLVTNQLLTDHIQDQVCHITSNERTLWNNKLNCENTISEERLVLTRN